MNVVLNAERVLPAVRLGECPVKHVWTPVFTNRATSDWVYPTCIDKLAIVVTGFEPTLVLLTTEVELRLPVF